jgi:TPR repeat protein
MREIEAAAESGDPNAQFVWAVLHLNEGDEGRYPGQTDEWLRGAAESGNLCAKTMLGLRGMRRAGMKAADAPEALEWLQEAAAQGAPLASKILLTLHTHGEPVARGETDVSDWQRAVAASPGPRERIETAEHYLDDQDAPPDLVEAYKWAELALLASDEGTDDARDARRLCERLAAQLTQEQLAEATQQEKAWKIDHEDECVALIETTE